MKILGLYHLLTQKRTAATAEAKESRRPPKDPRDAYEAGVRAERLSVEADEMAAHAKGNEELMENTNKLIHYLATSKHKSRYRSLALTDLESAVNWLNRENGEPEKS